MKIVKIIVGIFCVTIALSGATAAFDPSKPDRGFGMVLMLVFAGLAWLCFRPGKKCIAPDEQRSNEKSTDDVIQEKKEAPRILLATSRVRADSANADAQALYKQVFYSHMGTLGGFNSQDIDRIYSMLAGTGEGIAGNTVRYSQEAILEAEFADRAWTWPEMDEWEKIFHQEGAFPHGWSSWWVEPDLEDLNMATLCDMLTVDQIKEILNSFAIDFPTKSKKAELVALLDEKATVQEVVRVMPDGEEKSLKRKKDRSKARGRELFRLIDSRAESRYAPQFLVSEGKKVSLVIEDPRDEAYIKKTLALNPDAVPPFFPGDRSRYSL